MTKSEYEQFEEVKSANLKYWIPVLWCSNLLTKVRQEGRIYDDMTFNVILKELNIFRSCCGQLINYDWISVPLVYTQVVTVAVYMFFMSTLLSRQFLDTDQEYEGHEVDLYVPLFTIGQFFFYMGWLKVAEQLINPFGEDDDDFEVNWCIDRNIEVSMIAADKLYGKHPKLEKDKFWNDHQPVLPYTAASASHKIEPFMGSTFDMSVNKDDMQLVSGLHCEEKKSWSNKVPSQVPSEGGRVDAGQMRRLMDGSEFPRQHQPKKASQAIGSSIAKLLSSRGKRESDDMMSSATSDDDSSDDDDDDYNQNQLNTSNKEALSLFDSDVANNNVKTVEKSEALPDDDASMSSTPQLTGPGGKGAEPCAEEDGAAAKSSSGATVKHLESPLFVRRGHDPSRKNNARGLRLDLSGISHQRYLTSAFCVENLNQGDETTEERRNAEKRSHLASRRRKVRSFIPPRKRTRRAENGYSLWLRQQRRLHDVHSRGGDSLYESDIGSGPTTDSPFGSMMSCTTSIPSPKQLRWAFRSKTVNVYGDNTSVTSSVPSPSGTEGFITDSATTPPLGTTWRGRGKSRLQRSNAQLKENAGVNPSFPSTREDTVTPFIDDLRKRLQVVSPSSPAPTSPLSDSRKMIEEASLSTSPKASSIFNLQSSSKNKAMKRHADVLKKQLKDFKAGISQKYQNSSEKQAEMTTKSPRNEDTTSVKEKKNNKDGASAFQQIDDSIPVSSPKEMRRSGSGIWNALRTWKTKRKEVKMKSREEASFLSSPAQQLLPIEKKGNNFSSQTHTTPFQALSAINNRLSAELIGLVVTDVDNEAALSQQGLDLPARYHAEPAACPQTSHSLTPSTETLSWENENQRVVENKIKVKPPSSLSTRRFVKVASTNSGKCELIDEATNLHASATTCEPTPSTVATSSHFKPTFLKVSLQHHNNIPSPQHHNSTPSPQHHNSTPSLQHHNSTPSPQHLIADKVTVELQTSLNFGAILDKSDKSKNISRGSVEAFNFHTAEPTMEAIVFDREATGETQTDSGAFCDVIKHLPLRKRCQTDASEIVPEEGAFVANETPQPSDLTPISTKSLLENENVKSSGNFHCRIQDSTVSFLPEDMFDPPRPLSAASSEVDTFGLEIIPEIVSDAEKSSVSSQSVEQNEKDLILERDIV